MADGLNNAAKPLRAGQLRVLAREGGPVRERGDEALMLEHGEGSEEAFEELGAAAPAGRVELHLPHGQNRQIAEELTQEVFVALVKNAERYQPTAKFTTYLYAIASNIVSKEWTRRKRRPKLFSLSYWARPDDEGDPLEHLSDGQADTLANFHRAEISEAVNKALMALPEHQREAFVLHRLQNLPYEEVAEIANAPVGTIKSRVVRAERALRPLLEEYREYV